MIFKTSLILVFVVLIFDLIEPFGNGITLVNALSWSRGKNEIHDPCKF